MNKAVVVGLSLAILLVAVGSYYSFTQMRGADVQRESYVPEVQVAKDVDTSSLNLRDVRPQFLPVNTDGKGSLTAEQSNIKEIALQMVGAEYPEYYSLRAIGHRYAVLTYYPPTSLNARDQLIDFQEKTVTDLPASYSFEVRDSIVYITSNEILYYKLDTSSSILLDGSRLSEAETYDAHAGMMPGPEETHTETMLTVSIFNPNSGSQGVVGYEKLRDASFVLP